MRIAIILVADVVLTIVACGLFGPGAAKWTALGLVGWRMRAPFYLLRLYLAPAVLPIAQKSSWLWWSLLIGVALGIPLASMSVVPHCPRFEPVGNLLTVLVQSVALAWIARRLYKPKIAAASD